MLKKVYLLLLILFCYLIIINKKEFFKNINNSRKIYSDIHFKKYLKSSRFDLMAKYLYIKSKDKKFDTDFFKNLY